MQSNRLMLIIAVVAGVMATLLAFTYIRSATSALEAPQTEAMVSVLFVTRDLPANHEINPETDVRAQNVGASSAEAVARGAVKADELEALRGRRIGSPLPAGMPLLYSYLAEIRDLELAPGMRAMTLPVKGVTGELIVPDDRIDIIRAYQRPRAADSPPPPPPEYDAANPDAAVGAMMSQIMAQSTAAFRPTSPNPEDWVAEVALSNVRVIAVGAELSRSRQQLFGGQSSRRGRGGDVTVEVTLDQALELVRDIAAGNEFIIVLRPPAEGRPSTSSDGSLE